MLPEWKSLSMTVAGVCTGLLPGLSKKQRFVPVRDQKHEETTGNRLCLKEFAVYTEQFQAPEISQTSVKQHPSVDLESHTLTVPLLGFRVCWLGVWVSGFRV